MMCIMWVLDEFVEQQFKAGYVYLSNEEKRDDLLDEKLEARWPFKKKKWF